MTKQEQIKQTQTNRRRRIAGFSMIELLVAVLVMGIGILGVTGLQVASMQNNREALLRSEAAQMAYTILDRIRSNRTGAAGVVGLAYDGLNIGANPPAANDCQANNCTQAQMVAFDQAVWKCSLGGHDADAGCIAFRAANVLPATNQQPGLPQGDGSVAVNGGTGVITVTVQWMGSNNQLQVFTIESRG